MNLILRLFVLVAFFGPLNTFAFKVSPMIETFSTQGSGSAKTFDLNNEQSDQSVPLEIEIMSRSQAEDGKEVRAATQDFVIYPEQVIVAPKEKRALRLSYVGEPNLKVEKAYRMIVSQVPADLKDKSSTGQPKASVKLLVRYEGALYVTPPNAKPTFKVISFEKAKEGLKVLIKNTGNAHGMLTGFSLILKGKSKAGADSKVVLQGKSVTDLDTMNILAESSSVLHVPEKAYLSSIEHVDSIELKLP